MSLIRGFAPVADAGARVLILGSMPGAASLAAGEYYAHRRNAFWPIMGELVGACPQLPYGERLARLKAAHIVLWDVLASCVRPGSLDARIDADSVTTNDFDAFLRKHPRITAVFFNGAAAETTFRRAVLSRLAPERTAGLATRRLPSTSPANASWSFARKLAEWRAVAAAVREVAE